MNIASSFLFRAACRFAVAGFVRVMENLESHGILKNHFPGLESHGFFYSVMENINLGHGK